MKRAYPINSPRRCPGAWRGAPWTSLLWIRKDYRGISRQG
jgi:hypothetical protein